MVQAEQLIRFVREREHQCRYHLSMMPNVSQWRDPRWRDFKRRFWGHSSIALNCWELVFYAYYRCRLVDPLSLVRLASTYQQFSRAASAPRHQTLGLELIRDCLVGPGNQGITLACSMWGGAGSLGGGGAAGGVGGAGGPASSFGGAGMSGGVAGGRRAVPPPP